MEKIQLPEVNAVKVIIKDFDIKQTLECGQVFRFKKINDNNYIVYSGDKMVEVLQEKLTSHNINTALNLTNMSIRDLESMTDNSLDIKNIVLVNFYCNKDEFENYWKKYFDLETDYSKIKSRLKQHGNALSKAMEYGSGIRILRQEKFETIISFIVSANNNISRIQKIMFSICEKYGQKMCSKTGMHYYSFPTPKDLASALPEKMRAECNVGYRDKYIVQTAKLIHNKQIDIENMASLDTDELVKELQKLSGIGQKVADCIALFAYGRGEVYPVDVWSKRVFEKLYVGHELPKKQVHERVHKVFGKYAGYAQQYLFYYGRENF